MYKFFYFIYLLPFLLIGQAFDGMTLFSVIENGGSDNPFYSLLVDNDKNESNTWVHPRGVASTSSHT